MLKISNLFCHIDKKEILNGIDLEINPGEIHILMGPNGSGKSSLARTIVGFPEYTIEKGNINLDGEDITSMPIDERARKGIFMAFQYPVEVPGINFRNFLRMAYNSRFPKDKQLSVFKFRDLLKEKASLLNVPEKLIDRDLNYNLSGGEKKKMEILQMEVLQPKYCILDETDSGLDIDALKTIFGSINQFAQNNKHIGMVIITHYEKILDFIKPDFVHILSKGKIIKRGGNDLIKLINKKGYEGIINEK
jgi:Fe-S cluster assembly ATP-binding protein